MTTKRVWPACAIVQLALFLSSTASAQQTGPLVRTGPEATAVRGETVATRARPELEPLGIRLGSFLVYPRLATQATWNDNVFAERDREKSDFVTDIMPGAAVESNWSNHALNFRTGADFGLYSDYTRLNYTDYFFAGDGRLDITRESALFAGGGYAREHEEPGSPDSPADAKRPTEYDIFNGFLRHVQTLGRFRGTGEATVVRLNYDKTSTFTGDEVSTAARDRTVYTGGYQLGYEFLPQYEAFVRAEGNHRDYDDRQEVAGERVQRTSDGFNAVTGIALDLGGVFFGDVYAGYLAQYFSSDFNDVSGFTAGGTLTWNVTTLTTLNARAARTIEDTTQAGSPAILRTSGGLSADHELLRNLILTAAVTITNDDYEDSNRNDYYYVGGVGARYLMNRNIYGSLGYQVVRRTTEGSDSSANSFWQNLVRVGIEAQL
jgi:hypothetical protein